MMQKASNIYYFLALSGSFVVFWNWEVFIQAYVIKMLEGSILASLCF